MVSQLEISEHVIENLLRRKEGESGIIYAVDAENYISALAITLNVAGKQEEHSPDLALPFGLTGLGAFHCSTVNNVASLPASADLKVHVDPGKKTISVYFLDQESDYSVLTESEIAAKFYIIRVRASFPLTFELSEQGIEEMFQQIRRMIDERIIIPEIRHAPLDKKYFFSEPKKFYRGLEDVDTYECSLQLLHNKITQMSIPRNSLLIECVKQSVECCSFVLTLDALSLVPRSERVRNILEHYVEKNLRRALELNKIFVKQQFEAFKATGASFHEPETFHFLPRPAGHFISIVYPKKTLDSDLVKVRAKMHTLFDLPTDRPFLMRSNAYRFSVSKMAGPEIENPHLSVKPSGIPDGNPAIVEGRYRYYHYNQGGEQDEGWGCAYRSLQTICSWYLLQGYVNRPVPTIKEIQECLVKIGDKPSSIVGSKTWIGSLEVGIVLNSLLGITYRIVNVSSGEEMSSKGGELTHHFQTQGTPIMIGGNNLAHTIIGVDYNKKTGEIKYLILDPHYSGAEDMTTIAVKGWCGWKSPEFWKKSFYNMCYPMRPQCI